MVWAIRSSIDTDCRPWGAPHQTARAAVIQGDGCWMVAPTKQPGGDGRVTQLSRAKYFRNC